MSFPGSVPKHWIKRAVPSLVIAVPGLLLLTGCGGGGGGGSSSAPTAGVPTIQAYPTTVTKGQGTLLSVTVPGTSGTIDQGVGTVTSGATIPVTPAADTTYSVTVQDSAGQPHTASVTVAVKTFTAKFVYVANAGGGVSGFSVNDATGELTELDDSPYDPQTPALHVTTDPQGKFLYVVNGDGINAPVNTVTSYQIDPATGVLTQTGTVATSASPWCAAVDPTGQFLYVRCDGHISGYSLNPTTGVPSPLTVPEYLTSYGTGDLAIHPSGRYLFCAGRTSDTLEVFQIDALGALTKVGSPYAFPSGSGPAGVTISNTGEYVFAKTEGAGGPLVDSAIYAFRLNINTGVLTAAGALSTGITGGDAYHGLGYNAAQSVVNATYESGAYDFGAFAFAPGVTPSLTGTVGSPYGWFGATGSDSIAVSRNGKWAFMTDYQGGNLGSAIVNADGSLTPLSQSPTVLFTVWPVSVTVAGTFQ